MKFDRKSYVLGILTIVGIIVFTGIAFANSEIGDRIVALWFHGDCSNCTGYNYSNLTNVPINITHNDTVNYFTRFNNFSNGVTVNTLNITQPYFFYARNNTNSAKIPSITWTKVQFTTVVNGSDYFSDSKFTIPPGASGCYLFKNGVYGYNATVGKLLGVNLYKNGVDSGNRFSFDYYSTTQRIQIGATVDCGVSGDYFEVYIYTDDIWSYLYADGSALAYQYFGGIKIS